MDAVEFIKERQRFCRDRNCGSCDIKAVDIHCGSFNEINRPEELVKFIEEWSEKNPKNPIVTNGDKFREVFGPFPFCADERYNRWILNWLKSEYAEPEDK